MDGEEEAKDTMSMNPIFKKKRIKKYEIKEH
jgi:hypothetical protein